MLSFRTEVENSINLFFQNFFTKFENGQFKFVHFQIPEQSFKKSFFEDVFTMVSLMLSLCSYLLESEKRRIWIFREFGAIFPDMA